MTIHYRDCEITDQSPTQPDGCPCEWSHDSYDGAPDSDTRHLCGYAPTVEECKRQIDDMYECDEDLEP